MPIHREPDLPDRTHSSSEESAVRRAPLEHDDAYELQDHEFTLEPDEPTIEARSPLDERTAPWSTMPPLPPWAENARAMLEPGPDQARNDAVFYDDEPTPAAEPLQGARTELLALRAELAHAEQQIARLERELEQTQTAAVQLSRQSAELLGQVRGQSFLIAELQQCTHVSAEVSAVPPAPDPPDDLQRIRGLGKRLVARLAALGVQRFTQIAGWSTADVEQIASQLGVRPKRVQREGWIKQARKLSERGEVTRAPRRRPAPRSAGRPKPKATARKRKAPGSKRAR